MDWNKEIPGILTEVREKKPLVHHLTNWVTIYDCANVTRAIGALPVMAHAAEEVQEMASIAQALVLNIGTLTPKFIESMVLAGKKANELGVPVVLDAVGAGATKLRTDKAKELMEKAKFAVIKGNSSEIAVLAGIDAKTRGVEASKVEGDLKMVAKTLAKNSGATIVITGKEDIVSNGECTAIVKNGHELMGCFVGTGCMLASVLGAFCGAERNSFKAAAAAAVCYGIAGELAAKKADKPAAYKNEFFDEIFSLDADTVKKMAKISDVD